MEGEVASQVSLWQVVSYQVPHTSNQPITYIGMLPVGMAAIALVLAWSSPHRHILLVRLAYVSAMLLAVAAQGLVTSVVGSLSAHVVTAVTNRALLLALPYLVDTFMVLGALALFVTPARHPVTADRLTR
jgi:hypothetical protein